MNADDADQTRNKEDMEMKEEEVTGRVIGAFYTVYNELGYGFLESVYEEALAIALEDAGLKAARQVGVPVWYRGQQVGDFRADIVVENNVILELKAVRGLDPSHESQLLNYLRATQIEVGLLLNFCPRPEFKRLVFDNGRKKSLAADERR